MQRNNNWIFVVIVLALAWWFREPIKAFFTYAHVQPSAAVSVPTPFYSQEIPVIVPTAIPVQPATVSKCGRPINNPQGCQALTTRETWAGMTYGAQTVQLPAQTSILVYGEGNGYFVTELIVDGHLLPLWVSTDSVYVLGD